VRYIVSQRLVPKQSGGRLLVTELLGSNLRSREAIALGENENRRLSDIIEAASTSGWHTFEQSLIKAYEEDLITDESALLYCMNRTQMRQRLDAAMKRRATAPTASTLKMKVTEPPPQPARPEPAPTSTLAFQEPLPEFKPRTRPPLPPPPGTPARPAPSGTPAIPTRPAPSATPAQTAPPATQVARGIPIPKP
jgi:twitching motility protein PilT